MMKTLKKILVAILVIAAIAPGISVDAAKNDKGVDWAVWQGANGRFGYASDKFVIAQIGGYNERGLYTQWTYNSQISAAIAQGKRAHSYIWYQVGGSQEIGRITLDYFLPKIQTPKGSIVALDYESGASNSMAQNTDAILYGMRRVKAAGYTPMYYSYRPYTLAHVDYKRILREFPNSLWIGAYPAGGAVYANPVWNLFPSMDGVAIWQFTDNYIAGGLDGNIDLTGITDNGYTKQNEPTAQTPAVVEGIQADNTPKADIDPGYTVKINFSATKWATGQDIPTWAKGNSYKVLQTNGDKVLLEGILSWINKKDVEIIHKNGQATNVEKAEEVQATAPTVHIVKAGETLSGIAASYGVNYQTLAANNGISNPNRIYPGQRLTINQGTTAAAQVRNESGTFTANTTINVRDTFSTNGKIVARYYPGESVRYSGVISAGGYTWIKYRSHSGADRFMAVRDKDGKAWGTFK